MSSDDTAPPRGDPLKFGDKIRLWSNSFYAPADKAGGYVGFYSKKGRHGILSCIAPLGGDAEHLFHTSDFEVVSVENCVKGDEVKYGDHFALVDENCGGCVWNSKTGGVTGYVGPRKRGARGEMFVAFSSDKHAKGSTVCFGDMDLSIDVADSNRYRQNWYGCRITNYKSASSKIIGGYLCSDNSGHPFKCDIHAIQLAEVAPPLLKGANSCQITNFLKPAEFHQPDIVSIKISGRDDVPIDHPEWHHAFVVGVMAPNNEMRIDLAADGKTGYVRIKAPELRPVDNPESYEAHLVDSPIEGELMKHFQKKVMLLHSRWTPQLRKCASLNEPPHAELAGKVGGRMQGAMIASSGGWLKWRATCVAALVFLLIAMRTSVISQVVGGAVVPLILAAALMPTLLHLSSTADHPSIHNTKSASRFIAEWSVELLMVDDKSVVSSKDRTVSSSASSRTEEAKVKRKYSSGRRVSHVALSDDVKPLAEAAESKVTQNLAATRARQRFNSAPWNTGAEATPDKLVGSGGSVVGTEYAHLADIGDWELAKERFKNCEPDPALGLKRWEVTQGWRKQYANGVLLQSHPKFNDIKEHYPHAFAGRSKTGCPIYVEQPGLVKMKALKKCGVTVDDLLSHYIHLSEYLWRVLEPSEEGRTVSILDMKGISMSDFAGEVMHFVKEASKIIGEHYPERSYQIFVVNTPMWFSTIWRAVRPWINEVTQKKTHIYSWGYEKKLLEHIDADVLPKLYGGNAPNDFAAIPEEAAYRKFVNDMNARTC